MNKRSAMAVAAGLVLAMIVAGVALATGITGPSSESGTTVAVPEAQEPIVRTVTRTIKVHETGEPTVSGPAPVVVRSPDDPTGSPVSDDSQGDVRDDSFDEDSDEHESDDNEHESDDNEHESDDNEHEDGGDSDDDADEYEHEDEAHDDD